MEKREKHKRTCCSAMAETPAERRFLQIIREDIRAYEERKSGSDGTYNSMNVCAGGREGLTGRMEACESAKATNILPLPPGTVRNCYPHDVFEECDRDFMDKTCAVKNDLVLRMRNISLPQTG